MQNMMHCYRLNYPIISLHYSYFYCDFAYTNGTSSGLSRRRLGFTSSVTPKANNDIFKFMSVSEVT